MIKKLIPVFLLIILGIFCSKSLLTNNYFYTHDGDSQIARGYEAIEALKEGQFPLRWAGGLNFFCGVPIFNFYYPLFYIFIFVVNFFGPNVIDSIRILEILSFIIGPIFFYLWIKKETNNQLSGLVAGIVYLFVPYRFLLVYVRGSPEFLSYMILPILFYCLAGLFETGFLTRKKYLWGFSVVFFGALFSVSHNIVFLFFFPIVALYFLFKLFKAGLLVKTNVIFVVIILSSIIGLSSFFWGPALIEQSNIKVSLVNLETYKEHFPTLLQLIRSPWGYGFSTEGSVNDGMSFMLGYSQILIMFFTAIYLFINFRNFKKIKKFFSGNSQIIFWFAISLLLIFLMIQNSQFIWEMIKPLQRTQYPWRILGATGFTIAALSGFLLARIKNKKWVLLWSLVIVFLAIIGNRNHLLVSPATVGYNYPLFATSHPVRRTTTTYSDEILNIKSPGTCYFGDPLVSNAKNDSLYFSSIVRGNSFGSAIFKVLRPSIEHIKLNLEYYPDMYDIKVNSLSKEYNNCNGRVCIDKVDLIRGDNTVGWSVHQTTIQKIFNLLSALTLIVWTFAVIIKYRKKMKISDKNRKLIILALVFFVFIFLRFYNLEKRVIFDWDQERDATVVKQLIVDHKPTLIGPRVMGPEGFFLGPYFSYLLVPFYLITKLDPSAIVIFLTSFNLLFFGLSFLIINKLFDYKRALIFLFLWSIFPGLITIDTIAWNPIFVPLVVLIILYLFLDTKIKENKSTWLMAGLAIGLGMNMHFQIIFLLPMIFYFLLSEKNKIKKILKFVFGFLVCFSPLVFFDLKHDFINLHQFINLFFQNSNPKDLLSWLPVWNNFSEGLLGLKNNLLGIGFYLVMLMIGLCSVRDTKDKNKKFYLSFLTVWLFFPIGFSLFGRRPSEYYFNFLYPFLILIFSIILTKIFKKDYLLLLFLLLILFSRWGSIKTSLDSYDLSLYYKKQTVKRIGEISKDKKVNVSFTVPLGLDTGYRYLLDYYNIKQTGDYKDTLIQIVIPPEKQSESFGRIGIKYPRSLSGDK